MKPADDHRDDARAFIDRVRHTREDNNISLRGKSGLQKGHRLVIRATATHFASTCASPVATVDVMTGLLERFEKICVRQGLEIPENLRPDILAILVSELRENQKTLSALKVPAKRLDDLSRVTASCGAVLPALPKEFPVFATTPSIFKQAAVHYSSNPRRFLHRVEETAAELAADPEFASLKKRPGMYIEAAWMHSSDPQDFLRKVLSGPHKQTLRSLRHSDEHIGR